MVRSAEVPGGGSQAEGGCPRVLVRWGSPESPGKALEEVEAFGL